MSVLAVSFQAPLNTQGINPIGEILGTKESRGGVSHLACLLEVDTVLGPHDTWGNHAAYGGHPLTMHPGGKGAACEQGIARVFLIGPGDLVGNGDTDARVTGRFVLTPALEIEPPLALAIDYIGVTRYTRVPGSLIGVLQQYGISGPTLPRPPRTIGHGAVKLTRAEITFAEPGVEQIELVVVRYHIGGDGARGVQK